MDVAGDRNTRKQIRKSKRMKQIQIKEYNKNSISKAKSPKRFSRQEQFIHSVERKASFNRRWGTPKKVRDSLNAIFTGRNLFTFKAFFSVTTSKNLYARKKKYIYNNYITTKKSEYMSNEQRYASVVTNLNKIYKNEEIQPDYPDWAKKKPITSSKSFEKPQQRESKTNISAYKPWKPEQRPVENPTDAFMNMTKNNFMNSPEWAKFEALMGKEDALKWFEAGLKQATQPWD